MEVGRRARRCDRSLSDCMLLAIFSRRPVNVMPASEATGSPLNIKRLLSFVTVRFGFAASNNAAAPATCGVAIDVPLKNE